MPFPCHAEPSSIQVQDYQSENGAELGGQVRYEAGADGRIEKIYVGFTDRPNMGILTLVFTHRLIMTLLAISFVISFGMASVITSPLVAGYGCCVVETAPSPEQGPIGCCQQDSPAESPEKDPEDRRSPEPLDCECPEPCCTQLLSPLAVSTSGALVVGEIGCGCLLMRTREFAPGRHPDDIDHPPTF